VNPELVEVLDVDTLAIHEEHLRGLITEHVQHTGSSRGEEILANWPAFSAKFALVKPKSSDVKACWVTVVVAQQSCACRRSKEFR
jgi:glutamate synthase (NADPH/NADH) large chain